MPSGVRVGDFRFREECIVVSRSGESASGGWTSSKHVNSVKSRGWGGRVCAHTYAWPLPALLTPQPTLDRQRRIKDAFRTPDPRNASAGSIPRDDRALTDEPIVNRDPRDIRSPSSFLSSCCIALPCPEFRSGPSASSITKRFDLVCVSKSECFAR